MSPHEKFPGRQSALTDRDHSAVVRVLERFERLGCQELKRMAKKWYMVGERVRPHWHWLCLDGV